MTDYSSANAGILKDKYNNYYCGICARLVILTEASLAKLPVRRTDQA